MVAKKRAIDFTNVKDSSGINPTLVEDGDYRAKIIDVRDDEVKSADSKNHGEPVWLFLLQLADRKSATYPYRCTLVESQFWKVRNILIAAGKQVPKKRVNVDPNNVVGVEVGITLEEDASGDKPRSQITAIFPVSELAEDDGDPVADDEVADDVTADDTTDDEEGDLDLDDL